MNLIVTLLAFATVFAHPSFCGRPSCYNEYCFHTVPRGCDGTLAEAMRQEFEQMVSNYFSVKLARLLSTEASMKLTWNQEPLIFDSTYFQIYPRVQQQRNFITWNIDLTNYTLTARTTEYDAIDNNRHKNSDQVVGNLRIKVTCMKQYGRYCMESSMFPSECYISDLRRTKLWEGRDMTNKFVAVVPVEDKGYAWNTLTAYDSACQTLLGSTKALLNDAVQEALKLEWSSWTDRIADKLKGYFNRDRKCFSLTPQLVPRKNPFKHIMQ